MTPYTATARRLMNLAVVVRGRAYHPKRYMIETVAGAIEDAAIAIQSTPVDEPGQLPAPAATALREAAELLTRNDFMIPTTVIGYATAPVTGRAPQLPPVHTDSEPLARLDAELRARRLALVELGHLSSRDDDVLRAAFTALIVLHRQHDRLTATATAATALH
ncbi:hypothetical protein ACPCUF_00880 [Streptomyces griseoincarnatus]